MPRTYIPAIENHLIFIENFYDTMIGDRSGCRFKKRPSNTSDFITGNHLCVMQRTSMDIPDCYFFQILRPFNFIKNISNEEHLDQRPNIRKRMCHVILPTGFNDWAMTRIQVFYLQCSESFNRT